MQQREHGFTLIELIVVIVILATLSIITLPLLQSGFNAYVTQRDISDANWQGRLALARFTRDVNALPATTNISTATNGQLTFVDDASNSVSYTLSGMQLLRNGLVLANGINTLTFSYYTAAGAATATISAIQYISITLNVTQNNVNTTITTVAALRNAP
ncbi:MAG: hypothetical protein A3E84_00300 [Gammaproteobacteria bacterium RIFCSPHIGHO2_12_FULL_42_13]|nr:MAG: hypothetical protein A3E84_00300 [Gammaproteobacteria bacterium RIFCSPHIGHO2_12_FULL_42_13]